MDTIILTASIILCIVGIILSLCIMLVGIDSAATKEELVTLHYKTHIILIGDFLIIIALQIIRNNI